MTRAFAVVVLVLLAPPSQAEVQGVRIPAACRELADRAGLPLTLTPTEAARAVAYLRLMTSQDSAVQLIFNSCGDQVGHKLLISLNPTGCGRENVVPHFRRILC